MWHGRSDRGSALLVVILLLFLISGLAAAMVTSSSGDTAVARNSESAAQAQAAAEAGLNHAIDAARTYLRNWEANFTNTNDAVSRLLRGPDDDGTTTADNGSLAWLPGGTPTPPTTTALGTLNGVSYSVRIFDDDDPALGNSWTAADLGNAGEGVAGVADSTLDHNGVFVIRATGFARDQTRVVVEAVMKPLPWPAIVTNGNLDMKGGPQILGDGGSVHANGNISEIGNSAVVQHDVTAVGTISTNANWAPVQGLVEAGQLPIYIPPVNVADYVSLATYRLGADGRIYNAATNTVICTSDAACGAMGFTWSSQNGSHVSHMAGINRTWSPGGTPNCATLNASLTAAGIATPNCGQGVYYAEASDVNIAGNLGRTGTPSPYALTILADGSVSISGTPHIVPAIARPNILIVTNGDLEMTGTANCIIAGQARVREQLSLAGTMALTGQIIIENRGDLSTTVTGDSKLAGNATVTNDRLAVYDFAVGGWREFRR
jgi:Tfp pilus assembly protein PilX